MYTTDSSLHSASVNSVAFAPHELGLRVAAASSDGSASVLTYNSTEGKWNQQKVISSAAGVYAAEDQLHLGSTHVCGTHIAPFHTLHKGDMIAEFDHEFLP